MSSSPLFSIITVVYNGEAYLEQTIKSVLDQDFPDIEYIIIDGGSTDRTCELIAKYESKLSYWVSEPDSGIYQAMNKGLKQAKGHLISFLNADDYLVPGCLREVAQHYTAYQADVYYGNQLLVWETGEETLERKCIPNLSVMQRKMGVFHPATFVRRKVFEELGGFDETFSLAADYEFLLRAFLKKYAFQYVDRLIAGFRVGGRSSSYKLYWEGYRVQKRHQQSAQSTMLLKMIKVLVSDSIRRVLMQPLGLNKGRVEKRKKTWRAELETALKIQ